MKRIIIFLVFISSWSFAAGPQCNHIDSGEIAAPLQQRACLMRALKENPPTTNLMALTYRAFIQSHSEVGHDLVINWDRYLESPKKTALAAEMDALAEKSDQMMLKKDFQKAFDGYSEIENRLQMLPDRLRRANLHFRLYNLQSMARALYGMGQYEKALQVYNWIPSVYPGYRQVLFETMWTAFSMGRVDVSLGTLASQRSSYFGKYLEPESYLVWIYVLRKLCRNNEINMVRNLMKNYENDLKFGRYGVYQWAKSDPIANSWANLIQLEDARSLGGDSRLELQRLEKMLKARFDVEKKRLLDQIQKVDKFSYLALDAKTQSFPPTKEIKSYTGLLKIGFEMWPGGDAEDWFDEIGRHRFMGESRCQ
jgi:tetratricopeptide (TPR) repeat protein